MESHKDGKRGDAIMNCPIQVCVLEIYTTYQLWKKKIKKKKKKREKKYEPKKLIQCL